MLDLFLEFFVISWRFLPWLLSVGFLLEYVLEIVGFRSTWLIRRPKRKKGQKRRPPLTPGMALLLGIALMLIVLALAFGMYYVNTYLSLGFQTIMIALMLDNKRLFKIGDNIAFLLAKNQMKAATSRLSRFVGRDSRSLDPHQVIGLTMNVSKAAVPAATVGPLFAAMLGGAPLMILVKTVLRYDWQRRDPLAVPAKQISVALFFRPAQKLAKGMLRLTATIMGFVYKDTPVSGVRYMLSDLERNGRHLLVTGAITLFVSIDILILLRIALGLFGIYLD